MSDGEQSDLFAAEEPAPPARERSAPAAAGRRPAVQPLAARMRPRTLSEMVGQEHIIPSNRGSA